MVLVGCRYQTFTRVMFEPFPHNVGRCLDVCSDKSFGAHSTLECIHLAVFQQLDNNVGKEYPTRQYKSCPTIVILKIQMHFIVFQQFDNLTELAIVVIAPRRQSYQGWLAIIILKIHINLVVFQQFDNHVVLAIEARRHYKGCLTVVILKIHIHPVVFQKLHNTLLWLHWLAIEVLSGHFNLSDSHPLYRVSTI